jgi:hypothetical protein
MIITKPTSSAWVWALIHHGLAQAPSTSRRTSMQTPSPMPKTRKRIREDRRFDPRLAEAAYWFLTLGTMARVTGELLRPSSAAAGIRWTIVAGGAAQALGLAFFFWTMWSRIRGRPDS